MLTVSLWIISQLNIDLNIEPYYVLKPITSQPRPRQHLFLVADTLLNKYLPYIGCPKVLDTDQGKQNINSEITPLCIKYNIKHIASLVGHPQSNRMVERRQQMILTFHSLNKETCLSITLSTTSNTSVSYCDP